MPLVSRLDDEPRSVSGRFRADAGAADHRPFRAEPGVRSLRRAQTQHAPATTRRAHLHRRCWRRSSIARPMRWSRSQAELETHLARRSSRADMAPASGRKREDAHAARNPGRRSAASAIWYPTSATARSAPARIVPYRADARPPNGCRAELRPRLTTLRQRHRVAERLRHAPERQAAVPAGCDARLHQHRAEQRDEGADRGVGRRHSAGAGRRHLWHELQDHAGIRLGLGLSVRPGDDRGDRADPAGHVQAGATGSDGGADGSDGARGGHHEAARWMRSSMRRTSRCWAAAGWMARSIAPPGRNCWRNAARWAAARPGRRRSPRAIACRRSS